MTPRPSCAILSCILCQNAMTGPSKAHPRAREPADGASRRTGGPKLPPERRGESNPLAPFPEREGGKASVIGLLAPLSVSERARG